MNRYAVSFLAAGFLIISGCATHTQMATPVAVKVTSDTASKQFVKRVRGTTLNDIAQQVPNARPLTINVKLDVTADRQSSTIFVPPVNLQRPVTSLSPDPTNQTPATVPVNISAFDDHTYSEQITGYHVVYTISDPSGKILESNQLTLDLDRLVNVATGEQLKPQHGLIDATASFLASRVKTLNQ